MCGEESGPETPIEAVFILHQDLADRAGRLCANQGELGHLWKNKDQQIRHCFFVQEKRDISQRKCQLQYFTQQILPPLEKGEF